MKTRLKCGNPDCRIDKMLDLASVAIKKIVDANKAKLAATRVYTGLKFLQCLSQTSFERLCK